MSKIVFKSSSASNIHQKKTHIKRVKLFLRPICSKKSILAINVDKLTIKMIVMSILLLRMMSHEVVPHIYL